jgi:hypothetical protein
MITFRVTLVDDSEHIVRVLPIDLRLAEREFGKTAAEIDKNPSIDETAFLLWNAMKRNGMTNAQTLDAFFEVFADVDRVAVPKSTKREASDDNSSN